MTEDQQATEGKNEIFRCMHQKGEDDHTYS